MDFDNHVENALGIPIGNPTHTGIPHGDLSILLRNLGKMGRIILNDVRCCRVDGGSALSMENQYV